MFGSFANLFSPIHFDSETNENQLFYFEYNSDEKKNKFKMRRQFQIIFIFLKNKLTWNGNFLCLDFNFFNETPRAASTVSNRQLFKIKWPINNKSEWNWEILIEYQSAGQLKI